jgi:hypothetical protein
MAIKRKSIWPAARNVKQIFKKEANTPEKSGPDESESVPHGKCGPHVFAKSLDKRRAGPGGPEVAGERTNGGHRFHVSV